LKPRLDIDQLRALSAAVSEGTFEAAARTLHVTPSAISQRVRALETSAGQVLLRRSRPITATPSGEVLLRAARQLEMVGADVARQFGDESPRALSVAVNADSLATWFPPALASLAPTVELRLHRADQSRTESLLRDGSVMAAVTTAANPVPGCTVRRLGAMRYRPCAAPAFARRWFADGVTAAELSRAPLVSFDETDKLQDRWLRRRTRRRLDPPRHLVPDSAGCVEAVALGFGWGMISDLQAREPRDDGRLIVLDPDRPLDVSLYWQQWRVSSGQLRVLAGAVRRGAAERLA
jgi:LysR family transcriptional regulator, chromosome initiation inhibitor